MSSDARTLILKLEEKLNEADASKEADTRLILEELLDDDAVLVGPSGELLDKGFILHAHGPKRVPFESVEVLKIKVTCFTDSAIVYSMNTYKTKTETFTLRFFRVWAKRGHEWRVVGGSTTAMTTTTTK